MYVCSCYTQVNWKVCGRVCLPRAHIPNIHANAPGKCGVHEFPAPSTINQQGNMKLVNFSRPGNGGRHKEFRHVSGAAAGNAYLWVLHLGPFGGTRARARALLGVWLRKGRMALVGGGGRASWDRTSLASVRLIWFGKRSARTHGVNEARVNLVNGETMCHRLRAELGPRQVWWQ